MWSVALVGCILWSAAVVSASPKMASGVYGVDVSYPMHHPIDPAVAPDMLAAYEKVMEGCARRYSKEICDNAESSRMKKNLEQAPLQHNYTELGFKKMRFPADLFQEIVQFYETYKHEERIETWAAGDIFVNHWDVDAFMVTLEDRKYKGGPVLKQKLWEVVQPILEEWVGMELAPTSLYGIRVYKDGAVLAPHIDRLPLVTSCIINVAQDVNEPWPLEVVDHAGRAHNITMEPGDLVLYESHTVLHGRPFPLNGKFFANIFVHFQPVGHEAMNQQSAALNEVRHSDPEKALELFAQSFKQRAQYKRQHTCASPEAELAKKLAAIEEEEASYDRYEEWYRIEVDSLRDRPDERAHRCVHRGHMEGIVRILSTHPHLLNQPDANQWLLIHEAARYGHLDIAKYLVALGADLGARTSKGQTPLAVAREFLVASSPVIRYLIRAAST